MGLEYDFDIVTIAEEDADSNSVQSALPETQAVCAQFRDARAADALRSTSPGIRRIFEDAGFDLAPTDSENSHGFYRPQDAADRERILRALFANIRESGVKGEYCGAFDFWQFLNDVKTARPREMPTQTPKSGQATPVRPKRRTIQGRIGFALGFAVLLIAVLKYLAATGNSP
ncbi:hypothetical protein [Ruegeria halocynthiae]|uniref:hypothetical protein n=1 Tax=Ruegeria halocynthiae TaxID=985054 RepID=UPI000566553F|nr:hypothetical protein [Ruegeria halocynthiae]